MSDDDQRRRRDETPEFVPVADEQEVRPVDGPPKGDRTEQMPRVAADGDRTRMLPAADDDATTVTPQAPRSDATFDGTRTERYPRSTDNWADDGEVWTARAGVRPPPRPGYGEDLTDDDWSAGTADEPRGKWWTPIAVGIVGLLLLGLLGWGIYLIAQSDADEGTNPDAPATPAAPVTTAATTRAATTPPATQTTEPPTSAPVVPSDITVPALKGLSSEEARAALDRKGLNYRLRYVASDSPAGTVIDSDPAEGQQVPGDTVIALIIAAPPTPTATPTPTQTTGPAGQQDEN